MSHGSQICCLHFFCFQAHLPPEAQRDPNHFREVQLYKPIIDATLKRAGSAVTCSCTLSPLVALSSEQVGLCRHLYKQGIDAA